MLVLSPLLFAAEEPREIVRRSVAVDERSEPLRRNYTYKIRNKLSDLDSKGEPKTTEARLEEILYLGGEPYIHLLQKDGKPLPPSDARKEQEKLDRAVRNASNLSPEKRRERTEASIRKTRRNLEPLKYVPDAFDFVLEKEVEIAGRPAWQMHARPRPAYKGSWAFLFHKIEATIWIDKADYAWVKVDATTLDAVEMIVVRLSKGSRIVFENMKVNDEIWMRKYVLLTAHARLGLIKKLNGQEELTFSDYRKFQSDSRVVSAEESH